MTAGSNPASEWVPLFVEWMHPVALGLAILLPLLRASIHKSRGTSPCFSTGYVVHDVASGLTMPSFLALALSGVFKDLATMVDSHAAQLAGMLGIVYTIANIWKGHPDSAVSNGGTGAESGH